MHQSACIVFDLASILHKFALIYYLNANREKNPNYFPEMLQNYRHSDIIITDLVLNSTTESASLVNNKQWTRGHKCKKDKINSNLQSKYCDFSGKKMIRILSFFPLLIIIEVIRIRWKFQ